MKKSKLIPVFALFLFSCSSPAEEKTEEKAASPAEESQPAITYPFTASYSSDWKIGDPANVKVVLDLYKAVEENRIDDFDKYLADTVTTISFDAVPYTGSKQDIIKKVKAFRSGFKSINEEFLAFAPLHSNDKNEDWVVTWMTERVIRKDGSKDSSTYQETWRFRDGKIYHRGTFARYKPS